MVAVLIIIGCTLLGILWGMLTGLILSSLAVRTQAQLGEERALRAALHQRSLLGGWILAGLIGGLASGFAISFNASFWTWLMFFPVGRIIDEMGFTISLASLGRNPPLGYGVVGTILLPIIGAILWLLDAWPFS